VSLEDQVSNNPVRRTPLDRFLGLFTLLRPGEGRSVVLFFILAFLLMVAYYILKILREPLLLVERTAEMKSYAYASIAAILLILIPIYGYISRRINKPQLTRWLTLFFIFNLSLFYVLGRMGFDIGFVYFVWIGIVSLMLTVQFWAYAADTYNLKSGERLFPVIMAGATFGGLSGPIIAGGLYGLIGPWNLILIVSLLLACTLPLVSASRDAVPVGSRSFPVEAAPPKPHLMGGLAMVFQDHYLLLLAVLMVLLNWVNTTGEYILAKFVVNYAEQLIITHPTLLKGDVIAAFYSQFYFSVNALTVIIQVLAVARIFRWIGVRGALLVLPVIAFIGYGLIAFIPVFSIIRVVKIAENSTDYSLMNTTRHTLYLPLSHSQKFEGKAAAETFFWRLGDLIQAGAIFVGLHWFGFEIQHFAMMNMILILVWFWVAYKLGKRYHKAAKKISHNKPPLLTRPLSGYHINPGKPFSFSLPADTFTDPDPGDVIRVYARLANGSSLPAWLKFDYEVLTFSGDAPEGATGNTEIVVKAVDFDGASVSAKMLIYYDKLE